MIGTTVPVSLAEKILAAEYQAYRHEASNTTIHRAPSGYKLPGDIASVVDFVSPTVHLPGVQKPTSIKAEVSGYQNVPKTLRQLYSLEDDSGSEVVGKAEKNKMAVTAFLKQYYDQGDLQSWWSKYCS